MEERVIRSQGPIRGQVTISGAKNSVLLLLAASVCLNKPFRLDRVPRIVDVEKMCEILNHLHINTHWEGEDSLWIDPSQMVYQDLGAKWCRGVRTSILFLGALLGRYHKASMGMPGGCDLGPRPIDRHLEALSAFGGSFLEQADGVLGSLNNVLDTTIRFIKPTVTGTANAILCGVQLTTDTVIHGAALEPEIDDLIHFLNQAGAEIHREKDCILIKGNQVLTGKNYSVMSDRIEAGTFMIMTALLKGDLLLKGVNPLHLTAVIEALETVGAKITVLGDRIRVLMEKRPKAMDLVASVYPGFPTDLQPQWSVLACVSDGDSHICDTVFPNRFDHFLALAKLGANYELLEDGVLVRGTERLQGAKMTARNLRHAAALVLGAMVALGESKVVHIEQLNRGYPDFFLKINDILSN